MNTWFEKIACLVWLLALAWFIGFEIGLRKDPMMLRKDGFPRRNDTTLDTPPESAIRMAIDAVEAAGAHPLLTEAVILLQQAKEKVSDFAELP